MIDLIRLGLDYVILVLRPHLRLFGHELGLLHLQVLAPAFNFFGGHGRGLGLPRWRLARLRALALRYIDAYISLQAGRQAEGLNFLFCVFWLDSFLLQLSAAKLMNACDSVLEQVRETVSPPPPQSSDRRLRLKIPPPPHRPAQRPI